jgi:hypothetical protein
MNAHLTRFWYVLLGFMIGMTFFCSEPAWAEPECVTPSLVQNAKWMYNEEERTLRLCQQTHEGNRKGLKCTKFPGKVHLDGAFGYTENPFNLN